MPELNSTEAEAAGPFGKSEQCALTKTIEYYTGTIRRGGPAGTGQSIAWVNSEGQVDLRRELLKRRARVHLERRGAGL